MAESGGLGVDADAVPGGTGPFGRTRINSVPVAGIASAWLNQDRLCVRQTASRWNGDVKARNREKMDRLTAVS